jgi:hypothetical protein
LSKAAQQALEDIKTNDYHGIVKLKANEIVDFGLAIYGVGSKVKAIFGPKKTSPARRKK